MSFPLGEAPDNVTSSVEVDVAAQAVDTGGAFVEAPFAGTVTAVAVIPAATLTGANTDSRTVSLVNETQAGVVVASKAFVAGVNAPADAETALTLSVVAGATAVAQGDILEFLSTHVGAGLAAPRFTGRVTFSRAETEA